MARTVTVTLGPHFEDYIQASIAKGKYNNVSEMIRTALRHLEEEDAKLAAFCAAIDEGDASPDVVDESWLEGKEWLICIIRKNESTSLISKQGAYRPSLTREDGFSEAPVVIDFFPIFVFLPIAREPGWPGGWMNGVQETYSG